MRTVLPARAGRPMIVALTLAAIGTALSLVVPAPVHASDDLPGIVGGTDAAQGEFPWMVRLDDGCGGALFTPTLVLTAAHCFEQQDSGPPHSGFASINVTQGAVDLQDANRTIRHASHVTIAAGFTDAHKGDDWALLTLDSPITGVPLLKIASDGSLQNGTFTAMGWGSTSEGGDPQRYLKKVDLGFISDDMCTEGGGHYANLNTTEQLCAGNYANGGVDTCQGDSGGPLVKRNAANEWVQVGITSWGNRCGLAHQPGVYTEVNTFASAICAAANALTGCPTISLDIIPNFTCPIGSGFFMSVHATGGAQPYAYSISGLPAGLSFNTATGQISGFINQAGWFFVQYSVSDGMNAPVSNAFWLTVTVPVPDVGGKTQAAAAQLLQSAGLAKGTVSLVTVWDSSDSGKVMSQSPSVGTQVTLGSSVNLTVGHWGGSNR